MVLTNWTITTNGFLVWAISATQGGAIQEIQIDGLETDADVRLTNAIIANATGRLLEYCPGNVTIGSGVVFDTLDVVCP